MISANRGKVELMGTSREFLSEYTCLAKAIAKSLVEDGLSEEDAWELISKSIELAKMSEDELDRKARELLVQLLLKLQL